MSNSLTPKIYTVFKEGYSLSAFGRDLAAGLIVGILALPMSIAFAIATGARPEQGIYTAIFAGFFAGIFTGSRYQVTGPTGAFIVLIAGIIQKHGYEGLVVATFMAGLILITLSFLRLGSAIKLIPQPIVIGFTAGIAVLIATTQIRDFTGIALDSQLPSHFVGAWNTYAQHWTSINPLNLSIGALTILVMLFWPKITKKVPGSLIAIIATTLLVYFLQLPIETIGDRYGQVPSTLPTFNFPAFNLNDLIDLIPSALSIAFLAGIESLLSAVVADKMTGRSHRSNAELLSQGIANISVSLFSGIPATGAIARTATNIANGGVSPISTLIHAITLLILLLFFGEAVSLIPLVSLSAILLLIAYNMSEWRHFIKVFKSPVSDIILLLSTFFLTVVVDLIAAILVGIALSTLIFISRKILMRNPDPA